MAYTNIDDPSAYFQTAIYTGGGGSSSITNDGNSDLKPDLVWFATRSAANNKPLLDSTRGGNKFIYSDLSQGADTGDAGVGIATFNTDGFTFGSTAQTYFNDTNKTYVAWQWKANGGTTASNTVGNINSVVQANTDAGFAIVTYTGNGSANQTIGHGLGAVPKMILFKNRSNSAYWYVYHVDTGNDTMTYLNLSNAAQSLSSQFSTPTTTTFNVSNENSTFSGYNTSGNTYVAYVFADVQGYSKFGSYVGNGNANGPFAYTGFKPAFLMIKNSSGSGHWTMYDNKRAATNLNNKKLAANLAEAENDNAQLGGDAYGIDFLSNGFKIRLTGNNHNVSAATYIYMAFAENPFTTSTGVPTTAR